MEIKFLKSPKKKFQTGDVVRYESSNAIIANDNSCGNSEYNLFVPKWLNRGSKKKFEAPWVGENELIFVRKLTEEEKVKFLAEYYHIYITL